MMAQDDDEISEDEAKTFAELDDETRKRIERYQRWQAKEKENREQPGNRSTNSRQAGNGSDYNPTLSELKAWVRDPENRSILRSLADQAEALAKLPKEAAGKGKKLLESARGKFL